MLKEMIPVASLKSDSPSTITFRRPGIENLLNREDIATGSVAAKIVPNSKACIMGILKITLTPKPIKKYCHDYPNY